MKTAYEIDIDDLIDRIKEKKDCLGDSINERDCLTVEIREMRKEIKVLEKELDLRF